MDVRNLKLFEEFNDNASSHQPDLMSEDEYKQAFLQIRKTYFEGKQTLGTPSLFYVTGLPGAGKSTFVHEIRNEQPDSVLINFDDLRVFHPRYQEHLLRDPVNAAAKIDKAVETMIAWACEEASKRKLDVILDDAAMGAEMTKIVLSPFLAEGYEIRAYVLVVPPIVARQSVHLRFEREYAKAFSGEEGALPRWVNKEEQDNAPAALVETVETLENTIFPTVLTLLDREGNILYKGKKDSLLSSGDIVKQEHTRDLRPDEILSFQKNAEEILARMQKRKNPSFSSTPPAFQ